MRGLFRKMSSFVQMRKIIYHRIIKSTMSWKLWKHPDPVPGGRPIFFKPEWPKESKNGFKTISCCCYRMVIFLATFFQWMSETAYRLKNLLSCKQTWTLPPHLWNTQKRATAEQPLSSAECSFRAIDCGVSSLGIKVNN